MILQLHNLDDRTRQYMLEELHQDVANGQLYISPRLSERGQRDWQALLHEAIQIGNDGTLANSLRAHSRMNAVLQRRKPSGGFTTAKMPENAPDTLAEGEFNRFYIRGLCRRAIEDGTSELVIYRAKTVRNPRPESEARIGARVNAQRLLEDLRANPGGETVLGVPGGPNSGLSVRLP